MRLYRHDSPALAHHERFGVLLQLYVEAQAKVSAGNRLDVVCAVVVSSLNASVGVADENFHAFHATEILFVAFLYAEVAGIVTGSIVVVALYVIARHLADVAEHTACRRIVVLPEDAFLDEEAGEAVELFLQATVVLRRELRDEALRSVGRVARVAALVLHGGEALVELLAGDAQGSAEIESVERLHVARYHHHVVGGLIEHHKLAVAVVDESAAGIYCLFEERIGVGARLVFLVVDLQVEKTYHVDQPYEQYKAADDILAFL